MTRAGAANTGAYLRGLAGSPRIDQETLLVVEDDVARADVPVEPLNLEQRRHSVDKGHNSRADQVRLAFAVEIQMSAMWPGDDVTVSAGTFL